jgi:serine/threonine-protein kinase RsbT
VTIPINTDVDIVIARQQARELAKTIGFSSSELAGIAAAISELARNIVSYAKKGTVLVKLVQDKEKKGLVVIVEDEGPGITDINLALQDGYSTSNSLGLGLPGVRRLMDNFDIQTELGKGTKVTITKWTLK